MESKSMKIVEVALAIPKNITFSYISPPGYEDETLTGRRVLVPFGKRLLTGVVVSESESKDLNKLKTVEEALDLKAVFTPLMLKLTKWVSDYYFCSWGETLKAALPAGMSPKSVLKIKLIKEISDDELNKISKIAPRRASIIKLLKDHKGTLSSGYLADRSDLNSILAQLEALENSGLISIEKVVDRKKFSVIRKAVSFNETLSNEDLIIKTISDIESKAPKQALFLSYLLKKSQKGNAFVFLNEAIKESGIASSVIRQLSAKGIIKYKDIEYKDDPLEIDKNDNLSSRNEILLELTEEQKEALAAIASNIDNDPFQPFLLHGVTGSGKTLIYLHLIKKVLDDGKSALILVPEISLTPQLIDRFERAFPGQVASLHSKLTQSQRYDAWRSVYSEEKKIVLGVRSAVFAPLKNIGLIIVDEEHESSYKQNEPAPRYNARDVAVMRGKLEGAKIVLGSATPSLESMENALSGRYKLLKISNRADGAKLPRIHVTDLLEMRKKGSMKGLLSDLLLDAIVEKLKKKEAVIIFQNRRGYAPVLECANCAYVPECEHCSVSLTYHKNRDKLHCHYCGRIYNVIKSCPECSSQKIREIGFGTQRIEEDLNDYFKDYDYKPRIERMDFDSTVGKGLHRKILSRFAKGETDILIGTQMVAKGLDLDRVTLVGVINADQQLYIPDFRATERTFQLLTQVSGRSGRTGSKPGEVIIQTSHPENFAIQAVKQSSFDSFYKTEIENRRQAKYPPYSRFCIIEFSGKNRLMVDKGAKLFMSLIDNRSESFSVYGPLDPYLYKLRGSFRKLIIIKNHKDIDHNAKEFRKYLNYAIDVYEKKHSSSSVKMIIDIDSFMPV